MINITKAMWYTSSSYVRERETYSKSHDGNNKMVTITVIKINNFEIG